MPINLRSFLIDRMGSELKTSSHADEPAGQETDGELMRELARAIRTFSAMRARESWSECTVGLATLEETMQAAARVGQPTVLCLGCAELSDCAGNRGHCGPGCIRVMLGPNTGECPCLDAVRGAVESFRQTRAAAGAPHHDLDCFVAQGRMIFTWRRLAGTQDMMA